MGRRPFVVPATIAWLMLFIAMGVDLPYAYYQVLRWVVCGAAILTAFNALEWRQIWATFVFGIITVLFNPIFPVHLTREIWSPIDLVSGILFMVGTATLNPPIEDEA